MRLSHYDPRWPQEFEQTRSSVFFSGDGWMTSVHHVGSTAVSGMVARPTIDAIATVRDVDAMDTAATIIEGLNFRRITPPMWAADAIRLRKPRHVADGDVPTHEIYVVLEDSPTLRDAVVVRDQLRADRELSLRFEDAKVHRWKESGGDAEAYERDKAMFFKHLLEQSGR